MISVLTNHLANHLWQSTLFAIAAGLLTLVLRNNGAHTRYWVWFAASMKFLIPFSLLVAIGGQFSWPSTPSISLSTISVDQPHNSTNRDSTNWSEVVEQIAQPLVQVPVLSATTSISAEYVDAATDAVVPDFNIAPIALTIWVIGFAVVVCVWLVKWLRLRTILRSAYTLPIGRAPGRGIETKISSAIMEPGIIGIIRPVLLIPQGIHERLTPAQLQAIVAHELCHVRRRDNLTAAVHMLIEAVFWFHPLVWWIGARLVAERERACDEAVISAGNKPEVYAEGILNVCEFYIASPLPCAAGVSGADLKKRIADIMSKRTMRQMRVFKKLLFTALGLLVIMGPMLAGVFGTSTVQARAAAMDSVSVEAERRLLYEKNDANATRGENRMPTQESPSGVANRVIRRERAKVIVFADETPTKAASATVAMRQLDEVAIPGVEAQYGVEFLPSDREKETVPMLDIGRSEASQTSYEQKIASVSNAVGQSAYTTQTGTAQLKADNLTDTLTNEATSKDTDPRDGSCEALSTLYDASGNRRFDWQALDDSNLIVRVRRNGNLYHLHLGRPINRLEQRRTIDFAGSYQLCGNGRSFIGNRPPYGFTWPGAGESNNPDIHVGNTSSWVGIGIGQGGTRIDGMLRLSAVDIPRLEAHYGVKIKLAPGAPKQNAETKNNIAPIEQFKTSVEADAIVRGDDCVALSTLYLGKTHQYDLQALDNRNLVLWVHETGNAYRIHLERSMNLESRRPKLDFIADTHVCGDGRAKIVYWYMEQPLNSKRDPLPTGADGLPYAGGIPSYPVAYSVRIDVLQRLDEAGITQLEEQHKVKLAPKKAAKT